jgi:hypothetical protein
MRWRSQNRPRSRFGVIPLRSAATAALGTTPLHYWDFTANRALFNSVDVGAVTATPNWSFTRASTGYAQTLAGTLVNFGSGAPRLTDKGLLIEEARTNICLQSQTLDNATWTKNSATINANAYTAPDATLTMDGLQASAGLAAHNASQSITWTAAVHSASAYVRYVNHRWVALSIFDGTTLQVASFDLLNGVVGALSNATSAIESLGGGVYRISMTGSAALLAAAGNAALNMNNTNTATQETWTAAGTEIIGAWGLQVEAGSAATSYIPTTTIAVPRAADQPVVTSPGVNYPLTIYSQFNRTAGAIATNTFSLSLDDASALNRSSILVNNTTGIVGPVVTAGGVTQFNPSISPALAANVTTKVAMRISAASANAARDNVLQTASGAITVPAAPTTLHFGLNQTNTGWLNGYVLRAAIFNTALADAALQRTTT